MTPGFSIFVSENKIQIQNHTTPKYDNIIVENSELELMIEGIILNKKQLLTDYALSDFSTLILEIYRHRKEKFVQQLEGEFRGYVWNKIENEIHIFTNPTATQRVFYLKREQSFWADSDLNRLVARLKSDGFSPTIDLQALYQLLCIGNMLEDQTPIVGVKKILDGHFISLDIDNCHLTKTEYFQPYSSEYFNGSKDKALQEMHRIFSNAVKMEYEKDAELNTKSLALLSGGLDSRLGLMYAVNLDFSPENVLCFSQSDYWDHKISEKIANDLNLHYEFVPLDKGSFLTKIDQLTRISEGCGLYTGGIHVQYALDRLRYQNFSIFHSGQIGDGILGGFNSEPIRKKPSFFKIIQNDTFLPKINGDIKRIMGNYETEDAFLLRNIAYNRTVLGAQVLQQKAYQTSPFMTKEMLTFALSLKEEWKFGHRFYLEWIAQFCPEATKYRWERTLLKPDAFWKTQLGDRFLKPIYKKVYDAWLKTPQKASMYPYAYYFEQNADVQVYYQKYWAENLHHIDDYPELKMDVETLYASEQFYNKCKALNILSIFKLFSEE